MSSRSPSPDPAAHPAASRARRRWLASLPALFLAARAGMAAEATAPAQRLVSPMRLYVPNPAGGAVDVIARIMADECARQAGIGIAVLNVEGANGEIALTRFAAEPPDGRSWLLAQDSVIVINPSFYPRRSADPLDRLQPVAGVATNTLLLLVAADDPIRTFDDLARAASRPDQPILYGSGGVGSQHHLMVEELAARRGLALAHVPYRGNGYAAQGLLRGDVRLLLAGTSTLPLVRAGKLRVIAVSSPRRLPTFPDVPALAEFVPGFQVTTWFALFGSAGVPQDALAAMEALARQVVESQGFGERLRESSQIEAHYVDAATLTQRIRAERARIAALVARLPATASNPPPDTK